MLKYCIVLIAKELGFLSSGEKAMQYKYMYQQDKQPSNEEITENIGSETEELWQSLF